MRPRLHGRRPQAAHAARILPPGEPRRGQRLGARDHVRFGAGRTASLHLRARPHAHAHAGLSDLHRQAGHRNRAPRRIAQGRLQHECVAAGRAFRNASRRANSFFRSGQRCRGDRSGDADCAARRHRCLGQGRAKPRLSALARRPGLLGDEERDFTGKGSCGRNRRTGPSAAMALGATACAPSR